MWDLLELKWPCSSAACWNKNTSYMVISCGLCSFLLNGWWCACICRLCRTCSEYKYLFGSLEWFFVPHELMCGYLMEFDCHFFVWLSSPFAVHKIHMYWSSADSVFRKGMEAFWCLEIVNERSAQLWCYANCPPLLTIRQKKKKKKKKKKEQSDYKYMWILHKGV